MKFDVYQKEIELDKALLVMGSCFELSDIAGINSINHAKNQMFNEEFEDIDFAVVYEDGANKAQDKEKKTGLIKKAIDKVLDLIQSIKEKILEKKKKGDLDKIPDNQEIEIKKSTLVASKIFKKATNAIKKLLANIGKYVLWGAASGAICAVVINLVSSINSAMNKKTKPVAVPAKVIKGTVKDIGNVVGATGDRLNMIKRDVKSNLQSSQLNIFQKIISVIAGFVKAAKRIAFDMYFSTATVFVYH